MPKTSKDVDELISVQILQELRGLGETLKSIEGLLIKFTLPRYMYIPKDLCEEGKRKVEESDKTWAEKISKINNDVKRYREALDEQEKIRIEQAEFEAFIKDESFKEFVKTYKETVDNQIIVKQGLKEALLILGRFHPQSINTGEQLFEFVRFKKELREKLEGLLSRF